MPAGSKRRRVPGTDGACGLELQQQHQAGRMVGPARGKGDRRQALPTKTSFLKKMKCLEGQHQAGKQPQASTEARHKERGADTSACPQLGCSL